MAQNSGLVDWIADSVVTSLEEAGTCCHIVQLLGMLTAAEVAEEHISYSDGCSKQDYEIGIGTCTVAVAVTAEVCQEKFQQQFRRFLVALDTGLRHDLVDGKYHTRLVV